jgi:hypothetical protein
VTVLVNLSVIRKRGGRFSEKIMLHRKVRAPIDSI